MIELKNIKVKIWDDNGYRPVETIKGNKKDVFKTLKKVFKEKI